MSDLRLSGVAARVPGEKRRASALVMLVLCLSAPGAFAYNYMKPITIDRSKIPGTCSATLGSYPMLFSVTDTDLRHTGSGGKVTDLGGDDIIFKGLDTTTCGGPPPCTLDHEIEKYVNTTGELVAWVRIPAVKTSNAANTSDTRIYMYYGDSAVTLPTENPTGVWDANFQAVWHLKEAYVSPGDYRDSTLNGRHASGLGAGNNPTQAAAQIGNGQSFDGTDGILAVSYQGVLGTSSRTVSAWFQTGVTTANHAWVAYGDNVSPDGAMWQHQLISGSGYVGELAAGDTFASSRHGATTALNDAAWHYVVMTLFDDLTPDLGEVPIYVDGAIDTILFPGNLAINTLPLSNVRIGYGIAGLGQWDGLIDEVRISNSARSACWIAAEYNNQVWPNKAVTPSPNPFPNPTTGFYTVGGEVTTAVELVSFTAVGLDGAVGLEWATGSELTNLGFHLYRATAKEGPFERITKELIPGLGSSPVGASYSYLDRLDQGVVVGQSYYYLLEDFEVTGRSERHGPVSAAPQAAAPPPADGGEPAGGHETPARITYGDPSTSSLRVLEHTERGVLLELTTSGFYAEPLADGAVRLSIPGFVEENFPGSPAVPTRRAWLEAVAGRRVRLASVRALHVASFSSLRPLAAETRELVASRTGIVKAARRRVEEGDAFRKSGLYPEQPARLLETAFQGETKKVLLELAPLRWDPASRQLLLAQKLLVQLAFTGKEPGERSRGGSRGRKYVERRSRLKGGVIARLGTRKKGLYAVRFEDLLDPRRRGLDTSRLRLGRQGLPVAFHVEPDPSRFERGSSLYFLSDGASLNPYGDEAVYELELDQAPGLTMPTASAAPGIPSLATCLRRVEREENVSFAAQFDVENLWAWAAILASSTKSFSFDISRLDPRLNTAQLELWLLGLTVGPDPVDNRVRVFVNGQLVGEPSWSSRSLELHTLGFPPTLLKEGSNTLAIENANTSGSVVLLDRFTVSHPSSTVAEAGVLEGSFPLTGTAELSGFDATPILLDLTEPSPRWLTGMNCSAGRCRFGAESGRRYLATEAALGPSIEIASPGRLKNTLNRYDYLVLTPRALLETAEPLLELRRRQGLKSLAIPVEDVFDEFGFGEPTPQAIRDFLAYAFHFWAPPGPRYVLLLGDGTYDYKDYLRAGVRNQVPPLLFKSSTIWTASDPLYAAVNGQDALPDLALGRLPASTVEEARTLVGKILAFEAEGRTLDGPAVIVSDNPDRAGDFEAHADTIAATLLAGRDLSRISLARLGTDATRAAILDTFDRGPSLLSYIGHGGIQVWAHENIFDNSRIASLAPQPQQPLVLTMTCLNGYFQSPYSDSLAETLVKAEGRGAIAVFSPSGYSVNDTAQVFHEALLAELSRGDHRRLGDVVLAAQAAYADRGALPEMIGIYHLFGDPALRIR